MSSPRQLAVRDKVENVEAEEMVKMLDATLARLNPRQLKKKLGDLETTQPFNTLADLLEKTKLKTLASH